MSLFGGTVRCYNSFCCEALRGKAITKFWITYVRRASTKWTSTTQLPSFNSNIEPPEEHPANHHNSSISNRLRRQTHNGRVSQPLNTSAYCTIQYAPAIRLQTRPSEWLYHEPKLTPPPASSTAKTASHTTSAYSKRAARSTSVNGTKYVSN
jgi:hypothetical protein